MNASLRQFAGCCTDGKARQNRSVADDEDALADTLRGAQLAARVVERWQRAAPQTRTRLEKYLDAFPPDADDAPLPDAAAATIASPGDTSFFTRSVVYHRGLAASTTAQRAAFSPLIRAAQRAGAPHAATRRSIHARRADLLQWHAPAGPLPHAGKRVLLRLSLSLSVFYRFPHCARRRAGAALPSSIACCSGNLEHFYLP